MQRIIDEKVLEKKYTQLTSKYSEAARLINRKFFLELTKKLKETSE
jgi:hypothetical protein